MKVCSVMLLADEIVRILTTKMLPHLKRARGQKKLFQNLITTPFIQIQQKCKFLQNADINITARNKSEYLLSLIITNYMMAALIFV